MARFDVFANPGRHTATTPYVVEVQSNLLEIDIVNDILDQSKIEAGWLDLRDEPLPAAPAPPGDAASPVAALDVLVAEDHPINRRVIEALLRRDGHAVTFVENGRDALQWVQAHPFDLVLMDMQMPEMDGLAAAQAIRRWEAASGRPRVPIVALTANVFAEDRERCRAAGMDDFLPKPIGRAELQRVLAQVAQATRDRPPRTPTAPASGGA